MPLLAQNALPATNFATVDWMIVAVYLAASVAIGIIANRYISKLSDFLVAGRAIRTYLGIATMTGTEIGLVTLMYQASDGYSKGLATLHVGVVWGLAALFIGLTGAVIFRLRQAGVMTIPEYYGGRYGKGVRILGGFILASAGILNMGLFLRAGADFVTAVTGLDASFVVAGIEVEWLEVVMTTLMVLVLIYTMLGGMVSVVVTDLIQFIVLGLGMVVITLFLIAEIGWDEIFTSAAGRGQASLDPLYQSEDGKGFGVTYVISMVLLAVSAAALWQSGTLRALSAKSPETAKRIYSWSSITFFARFAIPAFWGVCAFAYFQLADNAELAQTLTSQGDEPARYAPIQAMPLMIGHVVPSVILGIVVAAMMAAFMSTHDSYMLCWASVLTQDVVAPLTPVGDRGRIHLTRLFIFLQGVFLLVFGLWMPPPESLWSYMATTGTIYLSGASAVVVLGLYWKRASTAGALAALLAGCVTLMSVVVRASESLAARVKVLEATDPAQHGFTDQLLLFADDDDKVRVTAFALAWVAMIVFSLLLPDRPAQHEEVA